MQKANDVQIVPYIEQEALLKRYVSFMLSIKEAAKQKNLPPLSRNVFQYLFAFFKAAHQIGRFYVPSPEMIETHKQSGGISSASHLKPISPLPISFFKSALNEISSTKNLTLVSHENLEHEMCTKAKMTNDDPYGSSMYATSTRVPVFFEVKQGPKLRDQAADEKASLTIPNTNVQFTNIVVLTAHADQYGGPTADVTAFKGQYPQHVDDLESNSTKSNKSCSIM